MKVVIEYHKDSKILTFSVDGGELSFTGKQFRLVEEPVELSNDDVSYIKFETK